MEITGKYAVKTLTKQALTSMELKICAANLATNQVHEHQCILMNGELVK
jgi:hypothetical protein